MGQSLRLAALLLMVACVDTRVGDEHTDLSQLSQQELEAIAAACTQARDHVRDCFVSVEPEEIIAPCLYRPSLEAAEEILAMSCEEMYEELGVTFAVQCGNVCSGQVVCAEGRDDYPSWCCPSNMYCGLAGSCDELTITSTGWACRNKRQAGESCKLGHECLSGRCEATCATDLFLGLFCLSGLDRSCG